MVTIDANVWVAAFDPRDRVHESSKTFLRAVARENVAIHGPVFVTLEVACAIVRRAGDPSVGAEVGERLRAHPSLRLHPLDETLLDTAWRIGVQRLLRGANALYAAAAEISGAPLVSWDDELLSRAGAITPADWLAAHE